jgi:hypothetical protein
MKSSHLLVLSAFAYPILAFAIPGLAGLLQPEMILASYTIVGMLLLCRNDRPRRTPPTKSLNNNQSTARITKTTSAPFGATCYTR